MNAFVPRVVPHQSDVVCTTVAKRVVQELDDELLELHGALETGIKHEILDEVVDVLYRVQELAKSCGISSQMITEYAEHKARIRALVGKDKTLERYVARGVVQTLDQSRDQN